ncbi:hypothetical protein [Planctellipticum variicoloris]|uniref:hypothetical protein n=1 Tax=Planctellipticum variicoloris TaxID=3064265 RepID=UPI002BB0CD13|nr:hypothetical protein SH412_004412 [Planctomycetaceae bacterium SH412]HTN00529.1 hypothetical protein [Planctomycetaceae bacterium]
MRDRRVWRNGVLFALVLAVGIPATGCGYLLHPERRGQPNSGRIDPSIVLLDGLGCLFFLIPGVIAFAVDFSSGTIYLPPEHYGNSGGAPRELVQLQLEPDQRNAAGIQDAVYRRTGQKVALTGRGTVVRTMESPADFEATADQVSQDILESTPAVGNE